ncbi:MAG: FHA domain-containing protein [Thermoanaerobaculia bacterium]
MIIECSSCAARYQYEVGRFEGKPSKRIRCAKCQQVFEIRNPELEEAAAPVAAAPPVAVPATAAPSEPPPAKAASDLGDMTMSRSSRHVPPPPSEDTDVVSPPNKATGDLLIPKDRRFAVAITDGADPGKVFRIESPRATIGRTGATIPLDDVEVSREHAAIEIRNSVVLLKDLSSTNGTFVNGKRLTEQYELQNQDEFVVGVTTLMLIITWAE